MKEELKPCPFCGGEASKRLFYGARYGVYCDECDARVCGLFNTEAEAIAAWNARVERTCSLIRHGSLANMPSFVCWSCSECGFGWHHSENDKQFSFCPNCGAKVIEEKGKGNDGEE